MAYINNNRVLTIMKVEPVPLTTLIKVGDNLRAKTIYFDTSKKVVGDNTKTIFTNHKSGSNLSDYIGSAISDKDIIGYIDATASEGGADTHFIAQFTDENGDWLMDHYTFPDDADIVITSITTTTFWNNYIKLGITVDRELSLTSENPVQNKVITNKIGDIEDTIEDLDIELDNHKNDTDNPHSVTKSQVGLGNVDNTSDADKPISNATQDALNTKANINDLENGQLVVAKSKTTKSIENVSEDSGSVQDDPFIFQGTGTNNNSSETPTSPIAKQLEKRGNSVVVNQVIVNGNFVNTSNWSNQSNMQFSVSNNIATLLTTQLGSAIYQSYYQFIVGHKYLIYAKMSEHLQLRLRDSVNNQNIYIGYNQVPCIISANSPFNQFRINDTRNENWTSETISNVFVVDLTQWFGSNDLIPQDLLDNPEKFTNYYNGDLSYNAGTLVNCNGEILLTVGFNQWDEQWKMGNILSSTGQEQETPSQYRLISKNYIRVIPNTTYYFYGGLNGGATIYAYDKDYNYIGYFFDGNVNTTFTTPNNCAYIKFQMYSEYGTSASSTYLNNICINLHWDGERDGEYQPYTVHSYNTGTEELLAFDYKTPDGVIHKETLPEIDLSTLTFSEETNYYYAIINGAKRIADYKGISSKYTLVKVSEINNNTPNTFALGQIDANNYGIYVSKSSGTPTGTVQVEAETPTTEQGTPFDEVIEVDDYGTMVWETFYGSDYVYCSIPQGCKIFYPADYVLLVDDLNNYVDGDVTNLAKKTDLKLPELPSNSENGTYVLKATKSGDTITYVWVIEA